MKSTLTRRITGPGASSLKYDILTALLSMAAQSDANTARLALRLSLVITARYNWRLGTFAVGQREMARMWGVTERTAKREVAEFRARRWITIKIPAARGRVATYDIAFDVILKSSQPHWDSIGPDFVARLTHTPEENLAKDNVVPLRPAIADPPEDDTIWGRACTHLAAQDAALYAAWIAPLALIDQDHGVLTLRAPSRFLADYVATHFKPRILAAIPIFEGIRDVRIEGP